MSATSLPSSTRLLFDELLLRPNLRLRIGEHVIDVGALRVITRPAHPRLTSKAVAVLIELVRHAGTTITREQLLDRVWAGRVTTPDVLTQAIKELRRAFVDDARPSRYIETIPRLGYRLLARVSTLDDEVSIISEGVSLNQAVNDPERQDAELDAADATPPTLERTPVSPRDVASRKRLSPYFVLIAGLAVAIVSMALWLHRAPVSAGPVAPWTTSDIRVVTSDPGVERRPAVSADGTRVAYSQLEAPGGVERIFIRVIGESKSILLTNKSSSMEEMPIWSPDGTRIAFERLDGDHCTMFIASIVGGTEREVGDCHDFTVNYFDWTPDGHGLITSDHVGGSTGSMTLVRWNLDSGIKQAIDYARTPDDQDLEAHYSPDGSMLAFRRGLAPYSNLYVMPASGGTVRQLTALSARIRGLAWTADGKGVIFSSDHEGRASLYTASLDNGQINPVDVGPAVYPAAARAADTIVYEIPRSVNRLARIALGNPQSDPEFLAKSTGNDGSPALDAAADKLAFVSNRSGSQQIWIYDLTLGVASMLTDFRDAVLLNPAWSSDGRRLLVAVRQANRARLVEIELATRHERTRSQPADNVLSADYGPDADSYLVVLGKAPERNAFTLIEHAGTAAESRKLLARGVEHTQFDRASRRVYYSRTANKGLFVRELDGDNEQLIRASIEPSLLDGWRIVDGRVWYVSKIAWTPTDIIEFDPASGATRIVGHLNAEIRDLAFSVAASRDYLFFTPLGLEDTDVGSFRLSRNRML